MGLFKNIDLVRFNAQVGLSNRLTAREIEAEASAMSRKHLERVVGKDLIQELDTNFETIKIAGDEYQTALELFERALYFFILDKLIPKKRVQVGAGGITTQSTDNSQPASEREVSNLQDTLLESAYDAIEDLLQHLEDSPGVTEYANSDERKHRNSLFIPNATMFNELYRLQKHQQTYLYLIPTLRMSETLYIESVIGTPYFNYLKQALEDDALTTYDKGALALVRLVLANYAVYEGCKSNFVQLRPDGVFFTEYLNTDGKALTKATLEGLNTKINEAKIHAELMISKLNVYLLDNIEDIPIYKAWYEEANPEPEENIFEKHHRFGCRDKESKIFW